MDELIAKRYANAILGNSDSKSISDYSAILSVLSEVLKSNKNIRDGLASPVVAKDKKVAMITEALGSSCDTTLGNLFKVLAEKGRLNIIPSISKIINAQLQKKENSYSGIVSSKNKLDASELKALEEKLSSYTNSKITLVQEISSSDNMKVSVNDLGIEVDFSKERVKNNLIDFISQAI